MEQPEVLMIQLNRRKFLYASAAVSAATAFAPHLFASEGLWQPGNSAPTEACTGPSIQPQFGKDCDFVNWREQGLNLGEGTVNYLQYLR
jgi:hypothetical protein